MDLEVNEEELFEMLGDLRGDLTNLKIDSKNQASVVEIREILNKIFPEAKCTEVIFTDNTDNMLFGINISPIISNEQVVDIIINDSSYMITSYKVEFDSKLFNSFPSFTEDEILGFLIHSIDALVSTDKPIRMVRYELDKYLLDNDETLKITDYAPYIEILGFVIRNSVRKCTSIFNTGKMYIPNDIDQEFGLVPFIKTGITKLINNSDLWDVKVDGSNPILEWGLRIYKDILTYRIPALHTLKKAIAITGSAFEKADMMNLINKLNRIDDTNILKESVESTQVISAINIPVTKISDDFAIVKALPVTTMREAYDTLHTITKNMSIINTIMEEKEFSPNAIDEMTDMVEYYDKLRHFLVETKIPSFINI